MDKPANRLSDLRRLENGNYFVSWIREQRRQAGALPLRWLLQYLLLSRRRPLVAQAKLSHRQLLLTTDGQSGEVILTKRALELDPLLLVIAVRLPVLRLVRAIQLLSSFAPQSQKKLPVQRRKVKANNINRNSNNDMKIFWVTVSRGGLRG